MRYRFSSSEKWQATKCSSSISRHSGVSALQRSCAKEQRVWNLQPDGGLIGLGISPSSLIAVFSASGPRWGIAESSALQRGQKRRSGPLVSGGVQAIRGFALATIETPGLQSAGKWER